jgi:hypothetical protein
MLVGCQPAATALVWFGGGFCGLQNVWQASLGDRLVYLSVFVVWAALPTRAYKGGEEEEELGNVSSVHKSGRRCLLL